MIKKVKFLIIPTILSFLGIEIFSTIFLKLKLIPDVYKAGGVTKPIHITYQGLEWRQDKEPFGRWHKQNYESKHVRSCFNIKYISNNIGDRDTIDYDNSFKKNSIIFLGDSFVEGYGLDQDETVTVQLEKITNRKIITKGRMFASIRIFYKFGNIFKLGKLLGRSYSYFVEILNKSQNFNNKYKRFAGHLIVKGFK